ncbi:hypothetical protein AD998_07650 [bacterium 336/3]|nr:hypothetical protein AD998_07650 [bacterium 336/3]
MNSVKIGKKEYRVPASWDELTASQVYLIAGDFFGATKIDEAQIRLIMTIIPANIFSQLSAVIRYEILQLLDFLPEIKLTKNLFPAFHGLYGPSDELLNVTVLEYATADSYFHAFIDTQDIKFLDLMVACFYRKPKLKPKEAKPLDWDGDYRQKFNANLVEEIADKHIKKLSPIFKQVVFLFFVGCKRKLVEDYSELFQSSGSSSSSGNGWADTIIDLGEAGLFGDLEKSATTYIHTAFMYFKKKYIENKELEAKYGTNS